MRKIFYRLFLMVGLAIFFLAGCIEGQEEIGRSVIKKETSPDIPGTAIGNILSDPAKYLDKKITVSGKVLPGLAFEFISEQPYRIIQGESILWVITDDVAPKEDTFVTVRGRIVQPYQIKGRSYELVLLEEEQL